MLLTTLILSGGAGVFLNTAHKKLREKKRAQRKLLSATRNQQATKTRTNTQVLLPTEAEKAATHQQKVALTAAGLLGLGAITSPIVALSGLPLLAYNYIYMMRRLRESYLKKNSVMLIAFDAIGITITLLLGFFFTTAVLFSALFTASRLIAKTEREAQMDFSRIFGELSDKVWLLRGEAEIEVPLDSLQEQDVIVVKTGEMIPVDGHILSGEGMVDQHLLTGEAQPAEKKVGDEVLTSTLVVSGSLHIVVEKRGAETITGQIAKKLEHAATFKHKAETRGNQLVEKGASLTIVATIASVPFLGLSHAMALTYSGFGYQMRLAAPLMLLNYLRIASRNGIFIKDGQALDILHKVDTVVFDKTGTLTEEMPHIERVIACGDFSEKQVLQYAASAEQQQSHPIAQAICHHAINQGLDLLELHNTDYAIGHGLCVELHDPENKQSSQNIMIGSERFIRSADIAVPDTIEIMQREAGEKGYSIVYVASNTRGLMGAIELRPTVRPQAQEAIQALHKLGITVYIISGDQEKPTKHLADSLGIDHYFAETLPEDKARHVEALQSEGRTVCFIGDGINDSVALQSADVAVSLHGAATIAQDTAEIVLMTPDLLHLPYLIKISSELQQRMTQGQHLNTTTGIACVSGVMLLGMGLGSAITLYVGGIALNLFNAMLPLLSHPNPNKQK